MSVRQGERKTSHLQYVQDAHNLAQHTLIMCNNEKHFPEPELPSAIKHEALSILKPLRYLLSTYTYEKKNHDLLTRYQLDALAHIDALYGLLELAYNNPIYKIDANSMEYWIDLISNLEDSLKQLGSAPICEN